MPRVIRRQAIPSDLIERLSHDGSMLVRGKDSTHVTLGDNVCSDLLSGQAHGVGANVHFLIKRRWSPGSALDPDCLRHTVSFKTGQHCNSQLVREPNRQTYLRDNLVEESRNTHLPRTSTSQCLIYHCMDLRQINHQVQPGGANLFVKLTDLLQMTRINKSLHSDVEQGKPNPRPLPTPPTPNPPDPEF